MNTMELEIGLPGNDTTFYVEYSPDTGIDEVRASSHGESAIIDVEGWLVTVGEFPTFRTTPLIAELNRLADIEFAEHREEWIDMQREAGLEYRGIK